ncbi:MAG: hypothetical protein V4553_01640 [Bacteroidota bacterium]
MKKNLLIFFLFFIAHDALCQLTYTQQLQSLAEIKFPDTPVIKKMPGNITVYGFQAIDQSYVVQIFPTKKPINELYSTASVNKLYDENIKLVLDTLKGTLLYKRNILINSIEGIEYSYTFKVGDIKLYSYNREIFLNDVVFDYSVISREDLMKNDKKVDEYFNSFKITIPYKNIVSLNHEKVSRGVGVIIFFVVVIIIGLGIVFLIKKRMYKQKNLE